ncbi:MAG: bifunctional hydroxymethylpyrimidine kinase/phosphomethylpyrimidine kinase [Desulfocapsa sp.]|nr:bifunctional hydroxymethylpyrimidine kinase/phosphomethylpyrimidine kinase [Desulfocapsa sp.]
MSIQPTLLSIAGSDPSGGAGIQADLKTMTSIGVYGAAAISCLTVQNSLGVQEIRPLSPDFVQAQVQAVLGDHNVTHIKIGMTGTVEILRTLGRILRPFSGEVIYDPVLASSTGQVLLQTDGIDVLKKELLPTVTYLTPNIFELQLLSKKEISSIKDGVECGKSLLDTFPSLKAVIVKGGHLNENSEYISDFLIQRDVEIHESKRKRKQNNNLHGTGCTYSSALASYLCLGNDIVSAFELSGDYMDKIIQEGMKSSTVHGPGNGPLLHYRCCVAK